MPTIVKGGDNMRKSYLKLVAKKRMMSNTLSCFAVSLLPYFVFSFLVVFNYYLPFFLKKTLTDIFLVVFISVISFVFSIFLWSSIRLIKEKYFLMKACGKKAKFFKLVRSISRKQYGLYIKVSVLKLLLSLSWSAVYFSPCVVVAGLLAYSYRYENYGRNVNLTLAISSIVLFVIGLFHFFVTIKRYSMCNAIILKDKQKNPIKIIAESIGVMEQHSVEYSLYCLSFAGWIVSCIFVIPLFYVLPFINMSKWCYMTNIKKEEKTVPENEKPIIFYIQKRKEV
ncbi:MAG: DUF975 family protein [Clostridia bacterium]|nr:DUF975 family protein [Clostridia bacterium]